MRRTKTLVARVPLRAAADDPVTMLWIAREKRTVHLDQLFGVRRRLAVGAHENANFRIEDDPYASDDHCHWYYEKGCFFVSCSGAKNRTLINLVPIKPKDGFCELLPGGLLTLGQTHILACGRAGKEQEPQLLPCLKTLLLRADALFGPSRAAAPRLGIQRRTYSRWLKKFRDNDDA